MKYALQKLARPFLTLGVMTLALMLPLGTSFAQVYTTQGVAQLTAQMDPGARGANVTSLQTFLSGNASVYPEGLITGYFGPLTRAAVVRFQIANGLPGVGRVGPLTIQRINSIIASGGTIGSPTTQFTAPFISGVSVSTFAPAGTALFSQGGGTTTSCASGTQIVYPGSVNAQAMCSTGAMVSSGNTTITWQTNEAAAGKLFYSTSPLTVIEAQQDRVEPTVSGNVLVDMNYTTSKSLTIPNLSTTTNSTYYYLIESIDANGNVSVVWPSTFIAR